MTTGLQALIAQRGGGPLVIGASAILTSRRAVRIAPAVPLSGDVVLSIGDPLRFVETLLMCSGRVRRMMILPGALDAETLRVLASDLASPLLISDRDGLAGARRPELCCTEHPAQPEPPAACDTEFILATSGTTGRPKPVRHTLASLSAAVRRGPVAAPPHWGLLYDPARFAGLQVVLQSLLGNGVLIAPGSAASVTRQLAHLAANGCSHLSATPSLWRRILMAPEFRGLGLRQITLGGEIADQRLLDRLKASFPAARITHVYASTEAGAAFSVADGRAGFPAAWLEPGGTQRARIAGGILWVRSAGAAGGAEDEQGFIRTGDRVERIGDRVLFAGREDCLVNIGGVKISPEAVEAAINAVPGIAGCHVQAKSNPVTGHILWATVTPGGTGIDEADLRRAVLDRCRECLPREAVPAVIRFAALDISPSGKVLRLVS